MNSYNNYKTSGIEWIGEIPRHWNKLKIGRTFKKIGSGTTPKSGSDIYYEDGDVNWLNTGDLNDSYITQTNKKITEAALNEFSTLKIYPEDSIVIALYGATIGKLGQLKIKTTTNQACCVLFDSDAIENRYLFYFLLSAREYIISKAYGGGQPNISQDLIRQLYITAPPKNEQNKIVKFLDYQIAIIDQLIQQKEKLIELLKEKRQATINDAVTKGLNPNVKIKDSGIEWLGYINTDWKVKKIKHTTFVKGRIGWQNLRADDFIDEGPHLVTGTDFDNGRINWEGCYRVDEERYLADPFIILEENDVLITKDGTIGKVALVRNKPEKATLNSGVFVTRPIKNDYLPEYFFWVLNSEVFSHFYDFNKSGSTIQHLYQNVFVEFSFAIPSMLEQERIVAYLNEKSKYFEELTVNINNAILKIKEYRQSLISEVVTGKIDVRDWQPNKNK